MKFEYSRYRLNPLVGSDSSPFGALLKIYFEDFGFGYCDCRPWHTLGDLPLEAQLEHLFENDLTPLLQSSIRFAEIDAIARASGKNAFEGLELPQSHRFLGNVLHLTRDLLIESAEMKFKIVKVKADASRYQDESRHIRALGTELKDFGLKLRIDFNEKANEVEAFRYFSNLDPSFFDWIEDPTLYHSGVWLKFQREFGIPLALDAGFRDARHFESDSIAADVFVHKPAVQSTDWAIAQTQYLGKSMAITHYLDHPLGQSAAAWTAAVAGRQLGHKLLPGGLISKNGLNHLGPQVIAPLGLGFGFDDILENAVWAQL